MNQIDQKLSEFDISQEKGFEHRLKLKKSNRSLFNISSHLPLGLISTKVEYCKHYYGYAQNTNELITNVTKLINTQYVSYDYEKYLNNENYVNFIYDPKRIKNYNKITVKPGNSKKTKVGESKNVNQNGKYTFTLLFYMMFAIRYN